MKCKICGTHTTVIDTRKYEKHTARRRSCPKCGARLSSIEIAVPTGFRPSKHFEHIVKLIRKDEIIREGYNVMRKVISALDKDE